MPAASASLTDLGKRIDKALREKGFKDADLARKMNVTQPQVYALKHITKNPRGSTIQKVAKALGKPVEYFTSHSSSGIQNRAQQARTGALPVPKKGTSKVTSAPEKPEVINGERAAQSRDEKPKADDGLESALSEALGKLTPSEAQGDLWLLDRAFNESGTSEVLQKHTASSEPSVEGKDIGMELKIFISFELNGRVVSKKQIKRLPPDFEF